MLTSKDLAEIQVPIVRRVLLASRNVEPQYFQPFLGSLLANIVGNLPDDYWEKLMVTGPCGVVDCDCHVTAATVMKALDILRDDHKQDMDAKNNTHAE